MALTPWLRKPFDDLDLLLAIVLAERALPDHLDVDALRLQLALGLDRAGVDGLPELVRGALRDDGDLVARLAGGVPAPPSPGLPEPPQAERPISAERARLPSSPIRHWRTSRRYPAERIEPQGSDSRTAVACR